MMNPATTWLLIVLMSGVALAGLALLYRRNRRALARIRGSVFAQGYDLFDEYRVTQAGITYPELDGVYRGHRFRLDAIVDTLTFRKLPVLWIRVSLLAPLPGLATLDILVRSHNVEFYSPSAELPQRLEPRPGWPADAMVRTDARGTLPDLAVLDRHIALFDEPQAKELLITPKGVRIVRLLDQAKRAEYLVLRQAEFESPQIAREILKSMMDRTIALHEDLSRAGKPA